MSLFDIPVPRTSEDWEGRPLAERMRPRSLDEYVGQDHILAPGKPLRIQIENGQLSSLILWGPPGSGKTTLASVIASNSDSNFVPFSAVMSGIKEIKAVMADAERTRSYGKRTILFVDEIHRFNKAQQDAFLPYVEKGDVILIGATTENPSFEVVSALLSRMKVYTLEPLTSEQIESLLRRAIATPERGLGHLKLEMPAELIAEVASASNGDARSAYNTMELVASLAKDGQVNREAVVAAIGRRMLFYDKAGEEHFNLISALHKSVRSSDPDAALYWLGRMLKAGEDRLYLARRLVRMAIEDIGLGDPRAIDQAISCMNAVHFLGIPEGDLALGQLTIYLSMAPNYLSMAPKSDASYRALQKVYAALESGIPGGVPMHLRNAPTKLMKQMGYAEGYEHAHRAPEAVTTMTCLPENLLGTTFYEPTDRGFESRIKERLTWLRERRSGPMAENKADSA